MASSEAGAAGHVVGIDLGTTNSVVAVSRKGRVEILANDCGSRITPSVVGFMQRQTYVGEAAADLPALNQVFDVKRLIGRPWREMKADEMSRWPFLVVQKAGIIRIRVAVDGTKEDFAPEELSALVLANLKQTAESALGGPVNRAVITVPAFFNERQRLATKVAGRIAELEVISIINEPTAAAIAYGLDNNSDTKKTVFIFDLGGGTFDVSVMTIKGSKFQVIATGGDTQLGGQDFDARLMDHLIKDIRAKHSVELDSQSVYDLRRACELAKRKLSALVQTSVSLHFARFNLGYQTTVTRALFEDLIADLLQKAMDAAALVLTESKVSVSAIDEVVLVGGSTRIPKVRSMLRDLFGGKELRHSINPDEAVAYGAAVQAAVLTGDKRMKKLVKLKDVTPLSLGVEITGDRFSAVIPKNTPLPCKKTVVFHNSAECGECIYKVFQGERLLTKDNHYIKSFTIKIPCLPRGQVMMDVTFELDAEGLLTVTCVERSTRERQQVTITQAEAALSEEEVKAMIEKAKRFRTEDEAETERVEKKLHLDGSL